VRPRESEVVDPGRQVLQRLGDAVPVAQLVHDAVQATLGRGAVVAGDVDDQGVVQLAGLLDRLDDAADLMVGVLHRSAEHLHPAGPDLLVGVAELLPRREGRRPGLELGVGRDDPQLLLPGQDPVVELVVAVVEPASVLGDPLARHPDRRLVRARGVVDDPRLVGMDRLLPLNERDRLVGHVGLQVIALLRRPGRPHRRGVLPQRRIPLADTGAVEAVEVFGAQAPRPPVERSRGRDLMHRGGVGLADQGGAVPVLAQDLQHGRGAARDDGVVAREPDRALRDRAHAHRMGVAPGQQRGPRRRAYRRGVEVGEAQPLGCQPVEHRGIGWPTERAHVTVADVVAHDQQHVRCALRRLQRLGKLPRRVLQGHLDPAPERLVRGRQHPSIRLVWRDWCAHDDGSFPSPRRQPPRSRQRARGNPRSPPTGPRVRPG
jgi:hypothetical protein